MFNWFVFNMVRARPRWPFESWIKTKPARLPTSETSSSKASNVKASTSKAHMETNNSLNWLAGLDDKNSPKKTKRRRLVTTQEQESIPTDDEESITYNTTVSNSFETLNVSLRQWNVSTAGADNGITPSSALLFKEQQKYEKALGKIK